MKGRDANLIARSGQTLSKRRWEKAWSLIEIKDMKWLLTVVLRRELQNKSRQSWRLVMRLLPSIRFTHLTGDGLHDKAQKETFNDCRPGFSCEFHSWWLWFKSGERIFMSLAALGEAEALAAGVVPIMAAGTVINATSWMAKGVTKKRVPLKNCKHSKNIRYWANENGVLKEHCPRCNFVKTHPNTVKRIRNSKKLSSEYDWLL